MTVVDIHSHIIPKGMMGKAGVHGPEVTKSGDGTALRVGSYTLDLGNYASETHMEPANRIKVMDSQGLDIVGVTVTPLAYLYWLPATEGVSFAAVVNDCLAEFCQFDPERFFFIPTVPLQDIQASVEELKRTRSIGGRGVNIASDAMGKSLADEYFWPLYEEAERGNTPIFVHPYPIGQDGDPGTDPVGKGEYDWSRAGLMSWMAGYLHQETLAVASLMLGGVFDRFPDLKVIIAHGGGAIPYQFGRFEYAAERMANNAEKPLREYLKNFYFDSVIHDVKARQFLVEFAGADNIVIGSNTPGWDAIDGPKSVRELNLPRDIEAKLLGENAIKLFGIGNSS